MLPTRQPIAAASLTTRFSSGCVGIRGVVDESPDDRQRRRAYSRAVATAASGPPGCPGAGRASGTL